MNPDIQLKRALWDFDSIAFIRPGQAVAIDIPSQTPGDIRINVDDNHLDGVKRLCKNSNIVLWKGDVTVAR